MNSTGDRADLLHRAAVYQLFSKMWAKELDADALLLCQSGEMLNEWKSLGGPDMDSASIDTESIAEDFCRFVIGPTNHLPPSQSVWTDGELQSEVVTQLDEFAAIVGFESPWPELLADHFANQLALMALALKASSETDSFRLANAMELINAIATTHLDWSKRFLVEVESRDNGDFYGSLPASRASSWSRSLTSHHKVLPAVD